MAEDSVVRFLKEDLPKCAFPMFEDIRRQGKLCDVTLKVRSVVPPSIIRSLHDMKKETHCELVYSIVYFIDTRFQSCPYTHFSFRDYAVLTCWFFSTFKIMKTQPLHWKPNAGFLEIMSLNWSGSLRYKLYSFPNYHRFTFLKITWWS